MSENNLPIVPKKEYTLKRQAPVPPPRYVSDCGPSYGNKTNFVRYSLYENTNIQDDEQCLLTLKNKFIWAEKQHTMKLKLFLGKLELVSTRVCNQLSLLQQICKLHTTFLRKIAEDFTALDIPKLFLKYEKGLQLYFRFVENRHDFSYVVEDLCENIIDHFKARLLEYNFVLSEIRNICSENDEVKVACEEAENRITLLYQNIGTTLRVPKVSDRSTL